jgi:hypothetical protein
MISRPERPFDRALERKLRISLSRRNGLHTGNLRTIAFHRDDDTDLENLREIPGIDIPSERTGATEV